MEAPLLSSVSPSAVFIAGCGLVLLGTLFRWRYTDALIRAEEHAKEGLLSEEQARRKIAIARFSGPTLIVVGLTALVMVVWL